MATSITPKQLPKIPKLDYKNIRPLLKTGDIFLQWRLFF